VRGRPKDIFVDPPKKRKVIEDKIFYLVFWSSTGITFDLKPCYDTTYVEVDVYALEN
jgi:hypothetical protein